MLDPKGHDRFRREHRIEVRRSIMLPGHILQNPCADQDVNLLRYTICRKPFFPCHAALPSLHHAYEFNRKKLEFLKGRAVECPETPAVSDMDEIHSIPIRMSSRTEPCRGHLTPVDVRLSIARDHCQFLDIRDVEHDEHVFHYEIFDVGSCPAGCYIRIETLPMDMDTFVACCPKTFPSWHFYKQEIRYRAVNIAAPTKTSPTTFAGPSFQ